MALLFGHDGACFGDGFYFDFFFFFFGFFFGSPDRCEMRKLQRNLDLSSIAAW
jgi:hypothetical protein